MSEDNGYPSFIMLCCVPSEEIGGRKRKEDTIIEWL